VTREFPERDTLGSGPIAGNSETEHLLAGGERECILLPRSEHAGTIKTLGVAHESISIGHDRCNGVEDENRHYWRWTYWRNIDSAADEIGPYGFGGEFARAGDA
jgi:hypothetical protein